MDANQHDREGLQSHHPFYKELNQEVTEILRPLINEEDKQQRGSKAKISDRLSQDLNKLGKELGKMFSEDTEDADIDVPDSPDTDGSESLIQIIPNRIVAYLQETKVITVRVSSLVHASKIHVQVSPEQLLSVTNGPKIKLANGETTLRLEPLAIGTGAMTIRAGDCLETVLFEVRRERPAPPPPPTELGFERGSYAIKPGRQKKVKLVAPEEVILEHGDRVDVSVKGDAIVKVGPPLRLMPNDEGYFETVMMLEARALTGSVVLIAHVGDTFAKANARVAKDEDSSAPMFDIEVENAEAGPHRAICEGSIILIKGKHPTVRKVLGKGPEFPLQNEPIGRAAIAEIVAFEMTKKVIEARFKNRENIDAGQLYFAHERTFSKYLRKCQAFLNVN